MQDQIIKCSRCGNEFVYGVKDQKFYAEKKFSPPKRCLECRIEKRAKDTAYKNEHSGLNKNSPFHPENWRRKEQGDYTSDKQFLS